LTRRFAVRSFGCQMNVYDSERMAEALLDDGHIAADEGEADIIVLNTCHIRGKAAEKLYSEVGRIVARADRAGQPRPTIAVTGCVAQAEGAEVMRRAPAVDLVVGPQAYHRLPELLRRQAGGERGLVDLDMPAVSKFERLPARTVQRVSAFLTVQEGCDKFCAFCVVPYTRGAEVSRPLGAILDEARALVDGGAREITLLGQNVNAWRHGRADFGDLLAAVAAVPGILRLRYTTSHPRDVTETMIRAHAEIPQLMPYLHLPVQSGSDRILEAMNRRHTVHDYLELVERFRASRPDLAITSDFIVGFPGETDADFEATLELVQQVGYAQAYSFKYSPRLGTPAADRDGQLTEGVKTERLARLQALLAAQALAFNKSHVGRVCEGLIERRGRHAGQWIAKSPWLQSVVVSGDRLAPGDLVSLRLVSAGPNSLEGQVLSRNLPASW